VTSDELEIGEFNLYAGGFCLDLTAGKTPEQVALVAEAVNAQSGEIADKRAFVERMRSRGEDEFAAVALATVFIHEVRHFHDILLTHVGQWSLTEGLNFAAWLPYTTTHLRAAGACVLPISSWNDLSPTFHAALAVSAAPKRLTARPHPKLLARLSESTKLAEATDYFYRPPADAPPYAPLTTLLFEGLATSCQLAELNRIDAGDRLTVGTFVRRLEARSARTYIDYFDFIETAAKQLKAGLDAVHFTPFNLLALRALCPLTTRTAEDGEPLSLPPALIFLAGVSDLYRRGSIPAPDKAVAWLDELADEFGWLTLDATFAAMQAMAPKRLAQAMQLFDPEQPADAALLQGYTAWIVAHMEMLRIVRSDPLAYCNPFDYSSAPEHLVACPMHLPITANNLPQIEGFLRGLTGVDRAARDSLLSRGLKPGFMRIGESTGKNLLPDNEGQATLFGGTRLGHALWRGFRPGQIAGPIARAELQKTRSLEGVQLFFL
jgi:hypothetical protein